MSYTAEHLTAIHEAGHAVVALRTYGQDIDGESVSINPNLTHGRLGKSSSLAASYGDVEGYVLSLLAGYVAQRRTFGGEAEASEGARDDFEKVKEYLPFTGMNKAKAIEKTEELVSKHWREIEAVAEELIKHRELDAVEVSLIADMTVGQDAEGMPVTVVDLEEYRANKQRALGRDLE